MEYSRNDITKLLGGKENAAQSAYFRVENKKNVEVARIAIMKIGSIYENYAIDHRDIIWQDSTGTRTMSGDEFLSSDTPVLFFIQSSRSPVRYKLVGEMSGYNKNAIGIKNRVPNTYAISFKHDITNDVLKIFENNYVSDDVLTKKSHYINSSYGTIDPVLAEAIGKAGEKMINESLSSKDFIHDELVKFVRKAHILNYKWVNEIKESFEPFDFEIEGLLFDVKTTITNSDKFNVSKAEKQLIDSGKLNIIQIWIDRIDFSYKKHKIISSDSLLKEHSFIASKYSVKKKAI